MFHRSSFPPPRAGFSRVDVIVAVNLLVLATLLLIPACQKVRTPATRTQSTNNLKQIGLAMESFHDVYKRLPMNGTRAALAKDPTSGSWAFQILPMIDQMPLFNELNATASVYAYMCPARGRPSVEDGKGAWSDYFINNYLNDPANADRPDNADARRTMLEITDGTSNTIFAGHGNIATGDYPKNKNVAGSSNIFQGGTQGTMRGGPKWVKGTAPKVSLQRDSATPAVLEAGGWGGPYSQGALMCFCDGTVRMIPYNTPADVFGAYLTPTGQEEVQLPD